MTRSVVLYVLVSFLLACSRGGAPDTTEAEPETTAPAPVGDSMYFRVETAPSLPCRPLQVLGCDLDGDVNEETIVVCDDGTSSILSGTSERKVRGRVLACADVEGNLKNALVVLSEGWLQAGPYSIAALVGDGVRAARIDADGDAAYEVVLWGFGAHPFRWSPKGNDLKEIAWAASDCVGDGVDVACASDADPQTWKTLSSSWGEKDVVSSQVDFTPLALLDVNRDGALDLAGSMGSNFAWAGGGKRGTWTAKGSCLLGLQSGVLVAPTAKGGWGLLPQKADPLPTWGSPLADDPIGAVILTQGVPHALVADPVTLRAWSVSILPRPIP